MLTKSMKAFSLIEVLVFVTILSLFFVAAVTVTIFNLRNMKTQEHKILATIYAEEGNEWLKQEKEDDWTIFTTRGSLTSGTTYCINTLDFNTASNCGNNYSLGPPNIFKREITIINTGSPIVQSAICNITVSWVDNNIEQKVIIQTVLNLWE